MLQTEAVESERFGLNTDPMTDYLGDLDKVPSARLRLPVPKKWPLWGCVVGKSRSTGSISLDCHPLSVANFLFCFI